MSLDELRIKELQLEKNKVYAERNQLVAALSKMFPAYLSRHNENDWEWQEDWKNIVYIDLPTGQVSWHIHDSELPLFSHLEMKKNKWDGHSYEEKWNRVNRLHEHHNSKFHLRWEFESFIEPIGSSPVQQIVVNKDLALTSHESSDDCRKVRVTVEVIE